MKLWRAGKFLVLGLASVTVLGYPAAAQAQNHLTTFFNFSGVYWQRATFDSGVHWSGWGALPSREGCVGFDVRFDGPISAVANQDHSLVMVAKTQGGQIVTSGYDGGSHSFSEWCLVPFQGVFRDGGAWVNGRFYSWLPGSSPVISSAQPNHWDVWLIAGRDDGAPTLLHGYTRDGGRGSTWEALGTGFLSGTPAVISWGPGRIDVFVRAGDNGLVHKWFDRGRWSPGWEDMEAFVTTNPTVSSQELGQLDLFVGGSDHALWRRTFDGGWSDWISHGGVLMDGTSPSASSAGPGNVEVLYYGTDRKPYLYSLLNGSWVTRRAMDTAGATEGVVLHWVP